ncbi:hypothetical protein EFM17_04065 [Lactobacillus delbrueckii]|nr:hypothetical protein [Lactobacillus delbrueckii]
MELYGYKIAKDEEVWIAAKLGKNGGIPDVVISISNDFLEKENAKPNPFKETRLMDLIFLHILKQYQEAKRGGKQQS